VTGEPTRRLAPNARWVWRVEQGFYWTVALVAAVVVGNQLEGRLATVLSLLPLVGLVVSTTVVPALRWRRWRWDVRPDAIEIRRGTFTIRHTVVPMLRVQHVDTTSDIVEQGLGLATVVVHTAAGSHKIPLLTVADAEEVRERIAALARTADAA
jgi:membrane protein YdbS with pleckstrin-like domain